MTIIDYKIVNIRCSLLDNTSASSFVLLCLLALKVELHNRINAPLKKGFVVVLIFIDIEHGGRED